MSRLRALPVPILLLFLGGRAGASTLPVYHQVIGQEIHYRVQPGDTLGRIAARYGMRVGLAATVNRLADPHRLRVGQELLLSNQHIVPAKLADGIVIDVVDRTLYWFRGRELVAQFPVAVGRADWETPPGRFKIVSRRHKPTWHVPPAIQAEMRERGEAVRTKIPPGPDNPLGEYWLQLSAGDYGIHGTNAPWSVGKYATHGCIRLRPTDVERLFHEVPDGTPVWVSYEPIKVAELDDGRVLVQAHEDIYNRAGALREGFADAARQAGLGDRIDLQGAEAVVKNAWGIPIDVTPRPAPGQPS